MLARAPGFLKFPLEIWAGMVHGGWPPGYTGGSSIAARPSILCGELRTAMKRIFDFVWPLIGFAAVAVSLWLLHQEFKGESVGPEVLDHFKSILPGPHLLAILSTLVAYAAL